jgi:hypothetical protein
MARVPYSGTPTVEPNAAPPSDYQNINPTPGAFGGVVAGTEQRAGQEVQQGAGDLAQDAILQQTRFNDHVVTDNVNQLQTRAEALTFGNRSDPNAPPGLYTLKGADALRAGPQVAQQIDDVRDQIMGNLQNDAQKLAFQQQTVRYLQYKRAEIESHITQETNKYGTAAETAGIAAAGTMAGNAWNSDSVLANSLQDASLHADKLTLLGYGHPPDPATATPEEIANFNNLTVKGQQAARTHVVQQAVYGAMAGDPTNGPTRAAQIVQKFGGLIDPVEREMLTRQTKDGADNAAVAAGINNVTRSGGTPIQPGTPASLNADTTARAQLVHDAAVGQGASDDEAWGWAANAVHESGATTAPKPGDGGISHGMFQLNKDQLAKYQATHNGHLPEQDDLATQLQFARSQAAPSLSGAVGPDGYAAAISTNFEVPAGGQGEAANRAATAISLSGNAGGAPPRPAGQQPGQQQPGTAAPSSSTHNPAAYGYEQQMMDNAHAEGQRLFPNNPQRARQVEEGVWQHIQQTNMLQAKMEAETARATKDAQEGVMNNVITTLTTSPDKFDPAIINNPILSPEQRENLIRFSKEQLAETGHQDIGNFGPGYAQAYKNIFAPEGDPDRINDLNDILKRGAPGGDLTLRGVDTLRSIFLSSHKDPDEAGVHITASSLLNYAKTKLSFEEDTGPVKIRDPKGEAIFNAQFVPKFESAFNAWRKAGKDPMAFLTQENVDKMMNGMRNPTQMANDRLSATGQLTATDIERPGTPIPPVPILPAGQDGIPAPPIDSAAWHDAMTGPLPIAENGQPYTHTAWATYLTKLMQNPDEKTVRYFDQHFGVQGYSGAAIVQQLRTTKKAAEPNSYDAQNMPSGGQY